MERHPLVTNDAWRALRTHTSARIGLGRAGGSIPTREWLVFRTAHAAARDAVRNEFEAERLVADIESLGVETVLLASAAGDKPTFLQRPDLGRRLNEASREQLGKIGHADTQFDLTIIASDGLSALAAQRQSVPLLMALLPKLIADQWSISPVCVARYGRVALEDEIGQLLRARIALMLIGERPGLGSPDSLSAYVVHTPRIGNTDANRNCVSNIRPQGLAFAAAAETLYYVLTESRKRQISGVKLKDQRNLDSISGPHNSSGSPVNSRYHIRAVESASNIYS